MLLLEWSEQREANEECRYNHVEAKTPIGRFLITWKGWKDYPSYDIEETPWGEWGGSATSLTSAKIMAEDAWSDKLRQLL